MGQLSPPCPLNVGSQDWLEKFRKTTLRLGKGTGKGHFRLGCEVSLLNLTRIVFRKNFKYAVLNITTLAGKTGHFLCAVEGDYHDIVPFKFTKSQLIFIVDNNNNNYWSTVLICSFRGTLQCFLCLSLYI